MCDNLLDYSDERLELEVRNHSNLCRLLAGRVGIWEFRLQRLKKDSKGGKAILESLRKQLRELETRLELSELRVDVCRSILADRAESAESSQVPEVVS